MPSFRTFAQFVIPLLNLLLLYHSILILRRWALSLEETLRFILRLLISLLLLDFRILGLVLSTTEEHTPCKHDDVSDHHADKASSDANHNADENWHQDMEDDSTDESGETAVSVVMAPWAVRSMGTRTAVAGMLIVWVFVVVRLWYEDGSDFWSWTLRSATLLQSCQTVCDNGTPFAKKSCAFAVVIGRVGEAGWGGDSAISKHQLSGGCLKELQVDSGEALDELVGHFDDLQMDCYEI